MRAAGSDGVVGCEDLDAGVDDLGADLHVDGIAVAVGPPDAGLVFDGDADPAGGAASRGSTTTRNPTSCVPNAERR